MSALNYGDTPITADDILKQIKGVNKMIPIRVFGSVGFLLLLFSSAFGQHVEEGWRGLLPFKSSKADVEKLFGSGKRTDRDRHYQFEYKNETRAFRVDYSSDPCDPSSDSFDRYNLPVATILRYEVRLIKPVRLKEFTYDANRCERTVMIYGPNNEPRAISYLQWEFDRWKVPNEAGIGYGIEIQVSDDGDGELATGFLYGLPYDRIKFKCSDSSNKSL